MSEQQTMLSSRMIMRADADKLPEEHELRVLAAEFDAASSGFLATQQTVSVATFMGIYAKTRKAWCAYSGDSLV